MVKHAEDDTSTQGALLQLIASHLRLIRDLRPPFWIMPRNNRIYPSLLPKPPLNPSASVPQIPEQPLPTQFPTQQIPANPLPPTMSSPGNDTNKQAQEQAVDVRQLQEELRSMMSIISQQQTEIEKLRSATTPASHTVVQRGAFGSSSNAKAPQISPCSGKWDELTSTRVKAFIYSVTKVGKLSGMTEMDMLALADCYFRDKAATWMMGLESANTKPSSIEELQEAMMSEFVPADERARAKATLMRLKMTNGVEKYISDFRELIDITETPTSEAFYSFSLGLPDEYKEELTKKFPTGASTLQEVYEATRTHELATQWTKKRPVPDKRKHHTPPSRRGTTEPRPKHNQKKRDPNAATWGPAGSGEKGMYRRNTRCFLCGYKWTPDHECKGDRADAPAPHDPVDHLDPKA